MNQTGEERGSEPKKECDPKRGRELERQQHQSQGADVEKLDEYVMSDMEE